MKTFTKQFMENNCGCYSIRKLQALSFMQQEPITLLSIVLSGIPLKDKFWFVCKRVATTEENKHIALRCAETVLPLYEHKYLKRKAPREAIEAAKLYIAGRITLDVLQENISRVGSACYTSQSISCSSPAYAAATCAAYAAYAAAYYASYPNYDVANDAASHACTAVAYVYDAANLREQQLLNILIEYCNKE